MALLFLTACKKSDISYSNYVNQVQSYNGTALAYLQSRPKGTYDSLLLVLDRIPALKTVLEQDDITFFAPADTCFRSALKYLNNQRKTANKTNISLTNADVTELETMLSKYIIKSKIPTDAISGNADGVVVNAINDYPMNIKYVKKSASGYVGGGPATLLFSDPHGFSIESYWTTAVTSAIDINTNNAIINILSPLHNFGFGEFTTRLDK